MHIEYDPKYLKYSPLSIAKEYVREMINSIDMVVNQSPADQIEKQMKHCISVGAALADQYPEEMPHLLMDAADELDTIGKMKLAIFLEASKPLVLQTLNEMKEKGETTLPGGFSIDEAIAQASKNRFPNMPKTLESPLPSLTLKSKKNLTH